MIFSRRRERDPRAAIAAFWSWWARTQDQVDTALTAGESGGIERALSSRIAAIHPEIAWELTEGRRARRALVLSPEGSPALRTVTERWLRAGPGADDTWEYHAARPADLRAFDAHLTMGGRTFEPGKARFGAEIDGERARVHVLVQHPEFPYLDDAERLRASFLLLDWALGEDDVERWLGEIRVTGDEQPYDVSGLRELVGELSSQFGGDDWAVLAGLDEAGRPLEARVRVPFPRLDHPLFDLHGSVAFSYRPVADGMPDDAEARVLEQLTDKLFGRLGRSALLGAVVTKDGVRTLHLYADSEGVVPDQVDAWAAQQLWKVRVEWTPDPGWEVLRTFY